MEDFIPTRISKIKEDALKEFVLVNYKKPKKKKVEVIEKKEIDNARSRKLGGKKNEENENKDERKKQELEMKRVRYEVMKFGISGFKGIEAEKAEVALAISLGAKPSKKKGINYKILKHERKNQKVADETDVQFVSGLEKSLTRYKNKKTREKSSSSLLGVYGKISKKTVGKSKK